MHYENFYCIAYNLVGQLGFGRVICSASGACGNWYPDSGARASLILPPSTSAKRPHRHLQACIYHLCCYNMASLPLIHGVTVIVTLVLRFIASHATESLQDTPVFKQIAVLPNVPPKRSRQSLVTLPAEIFLMIAQELSVLELCSLAAVNNHG